MPPDGIRIIADDFGVGAMLIGRATRVDGKGRQQGSSNRAARRRMTHESQDGR
jgi:hypothetical protein